MVARYLLLQETFLAPTLYQAGSVIETTKTPGNHWKPLNKEAHAALEAWYEEEFDELDDKGNKTGKKIKPRLILRLPVIMGEENPVDEPVKVVRQAPGHQKVGQELAEMMVRQASGDQRPPPAQVLYEDIEEEEVDPDVTPLVVAPRPKVGTDK